MFKLIVSFLLTLAACKPVHKNPHVLIVTDKGDIELELFPDKAPLTVAGFLRNVDAGMYNKGTFYRVSKMEGATESLNTGFIQGGIWRSDPFRSMGVPPIKHEPTSQTGMLHTDGAVSMARAEGSPAKSEFFISIGEQPSLNAGTNGDGYAVFGKVFSGMSVVRKIQSLPYTGDMFDQQVIIREIKKL
jgi:peptidyl-prolyl cis-trans isomerase A (cyclophilin A)